MTSRVLITGLPCESDPLRPETIRIYAFLDGRALGRSGNQRQETAGHASKDHPQERCTRRLGSRTCPSQVDGAPVAAADNESGDCS